MADTLQQLGVPRARVALESTSQTTLEQAVNAGAWLQARGETRFVLITAPEHMRRAVGLFTARGLHPIPSTSTIAYGGSPFWRPTGYALQGSEAAIYEYVAWFFYRIRGWL